MSDRYRLQQADALRVLADLETGSVDALVTDPPYSSGGMTRGDRAQGVHSKYVQSDSASRDLDGFAGDNRDGRSYAYWCALWLGEALRVVKPGGVAVVFTDWRQLPSTTDALQSGGWVWRGVVPWTKLSYRPQMGRFAAQCEYVVWGSAGALPPRTDVGCLPGFFEASSPRERDHITQKPLDVMRQLVKLCPPDGLVLDPFMGSGTTGVAALCEGRRFLGVDQVASHVATAEVRCAAAAAGHAVAAPDQLVLAP